MKVRGPLRRHRRLSAVLIPRTLEVGVLDTDVNPRAVERPFSVLRVGAIGPGAGPKPTQRMFAPLVMLSSMIFLTTPSSLVGFTATGFVWLVRFVSSPLLSAVCWVDVTTATPGMPSAYRLMLCVLSLGCMELQPRSVKCKM